MESSSCEQVNDIFLLQANISKQLWKLKLQIIQPNQSVKWQMQADKRMVSKQVMPKTDDDEAINDCCSRSPMTNESNCKLKRK